MCSILNLEHRQTSLTCLPGAQHVALVADVSDLLLDAALQLAEDELLDAVELLAQPAAAVLVAALVLVLNHQPVLQVGDLGQRHLQPRLAAPSVLVEYLQHQVISLLENTSKKRQEKNSS